MKNFKKLLLIALAVVSFAACGDDNDEDEKKTPETSTSSFTGTVAVGDFSLSDVKVQTTCKNKEKTCSITMYQVTFSSQMPMRMDITMSDVPFTVSGSDTLISGSNVTTTYTLNGNTGNFSDVGYSIPSMSGTISKGKLTLSTSVGSSHGDMTMTYEGNRD